ncbi:MAG: hypothetical protein PUK70_10805 [Bacteroidales bacterium]|nr:hypothetical protein [Bacteroidales bacterium]MDY6000654.1 hypothetical protein [Candidatus Cryptobacteroides sp.]
MKGAGCNILVSKALEEKDGAIDSSVRKEVICNRVDRNLFHEYTAEEPNAAESTRT